MILFYVQHLLGIGHLRRTIAIANACAKKGLPVSVVSGGPSIDLSALSDVPVYQLPPVRSADLAFSSLVDANDRLIDAAYEKNRRDQLLQILDRESPRLLVLELFPFGRRRFRFELEPLLDEAQRSRIQIFSSVRDCVQQRSDEREAETLDFLRHYFDGVLVHGDESFLPFAASFRRAAEVENLTYSGFVDTAPQAVPPSVSRVSGVIAAAGGGAAGRVLYETMARARRLTRHPSVPWQMLVGTDPDKSLIDSLKKTGGEGLIVEANRTDYRALLEGSRLSISQAGYNSTVDILSSGVPAVMIPFTGEGGETEQSVRAARLAAAGRVTVMSESNLDPAELAETVDSVLDREPEKFQPIPCNGAQRSAEILAAHLH